MILCVNTKDQKQVVVSLKKDGKIVESLSEENVYGSQVLLPLIEKLLKKHAVTSRVSTQLTPDVSKVNIRSLPWNMLEGIEVETGPGSFTGLRVGVSVANALGYSLGIPVNGKRAETDLVY